MSNDNHATTIIKDKLDVSYEAAEEWISNDPDNGGVEVFPETAVLLVTRCCQINHDHISLNKEQATTLMEWLASFVYGEYSE